jgi:CheY-like chemotaxis protein
MAAPAAIGDQPERPAVVQAAPLSNSAQEPGPSSTIILVVDDSRFERAFVGRVVEQCPGLRAAYAADGQEALARIVQDAPAVILTDLVMPGMDGLALVEAVRSQYPTIPVVLMTAHGSEQTAVRALRAGAASYIPKHALTLELHQVLRQVLDVAEAQSRRRQLELCLERWEADFVLENDPQLHKPLVELVQEQFQNMGLGDSPVCTQVGIALTEALANALYHGNLELSSDLRQEDERIFYGLASQRRQVPPYRDRRIRVHVRFDEHAASYAIRDEGPGFDTTADFSRP